MKSSILYSLGFALASTANYLPLPRAAQPSSKISVLKTPTNGIQITLPKDVVDELRLVTIQVTCRPSKEKRNIPTRVQCAGDAARAVAHLILQEGVEKQYWQALTELTPDELAVFDNRQPRSDTDLHEIYNEALGSIQIEAFVDPLRQRATAWITSMAMLDSYNGFGVIVSTKPLVAEADDIEDEICPANAPRGSAAPMCESISCVGGRVGRLCSVGKWRNCPCNLYISPIFTTPLDEASYEFGDKDGQQVTLFEDILSSVDCEYKGDKSELKRRDSLLENSYCSCSGGNYTPISSAPDGGQCAYSDASDLPHALPDPTTANEFKIRFTQSTRNIGFNPINGTYQLSAAGQTGGVGELDPDLLGHEPRFIPDIEDGLTFGLVKIDFDQLPDYAALTSEKWRDDISFNFTYFPTPYVSKSNYTLPIYQRNAIMWNTNNAAGTKVATSLPGYSCDDLTKAAWLPAHKINFDWQKRTWECSLLRINEYYT